MKKFRKGSLERKGKVIPCKGTKDRKGTGTNSGKSGIRYLEAKRPGSTKEVDQSMGGNVELETVTEERWSNAM